MPYSVIVKGQVKDISYKKMNVGAGCYAVFLGEDNPIGEVRKMATGFAAVSYEKNEASFGIMDGFKTRWKATEFILKVSGYH